MFGSSTVTARYDRVSTPTGGSHTENSTPAKNPARGWKARAIQVYQPPADGNTLASWAAFSACRASSAPPNRYAQGVTTAAKLTMNTNDARIAKDGAIVAIPCIKIPGIPIAFSCSPVWTVPWLVLRSSTATVSLLPVARRKQNPATGGAFAHGLIIRSIRSIDLWIGSWQGPSRGARPGLARQRGQAVMAGTARDDGPDVDHDVAADDVVGVVPVHGARRVPGHQGDGVADPQRRSPGSGEDTVLLVEPGDGEILADDGHVRRVGHRLVARVHDHLAALPADDRRLDRERVLEAGHHPAVEVVHDHVRAGLDLGEAGIGRGPLPGGDPPGRTDLAGDAVRFQQVGDPGEERHRLALAFVPQVAVGGQRAVPFVTRDALETQPGQVRHLPGQGQAFPRGVHPAAVHAGI